MIATVLFALAIAAAPAVLVLATLAVIGSAVAGLAEGAPGGLIRPSV
ncbi:MAG TPA: hypothetical protein VK194_09250 [Candidatus Deferrimicrobium sp.]|nr:hypothetical protein [Candidatus Deferrimicrobium sp.]